MNIVNGLLANLSLHGEEFHNPAVIMKYKFLKSPNIGLAVCTNLKVLALNLKLVTKVTRARDVRINETLPSKRTEVKRNKGEISDIKSLQCSTMK